VATNAGGSDPGSILLTAVGGNTNVGRKDEPTVGLTRDSASTDFDGSFLAIQTFAAGPAANPVANSGDERRVDGSVHVHQDSPSIRGGMDAGSDASFLQCDEVKQFLDGMAMHKLNMFHMHLDDDGVGASK
jgi:hypothetical protein